MNIRFVVIILLSSLALISGSDAFARKDFVATTCAGFNEKDGTCIASCQNGELAICHNASGANEPKCSCEVIEGERYFQSFLKRLKAELERMKAEAVKAENLNHLTFAQDVIVTADRDVFPDNGENVVMVSALCAPMPPELAFYCQLKFDGLFQ